MPEQVGPYLIGLAAMVAVLSYVYRLRSLSVEERQAEIRAGLHRARPFAEAWAVRHLPIWLVAVCGLGALGFQGAHFAGYGPGLGGIGTVFGSRARAGGTGAFVPGTPNAPTIDVLVQDTSTWWVDFSTFVGSGGDTQDSISVTVLRLTAADTLFHAVSGVQTRDTVSDNADLKADTTYRVLGRQKGVSGGWSPADTLNVVNDDAILFQMNLAAGAFPLAGFDALADTTTNEYHITRVAGIGPSGQAAYRLQVDTAAAGLQPYVGWDVTLPAGAPFVYGDTVFVRFRFRWIANTRCESTQEGSPNNHRSKFHIINDDAPGGNAEGRAIIQIDCHYNSGNPNAAIDSVSYGLMRSNGDNRCNSDGTTGSLTSFTHANDTTWLDFQYEHRFSTSQGATNGTYAMWIDNNTYGSPTCRVSNIVINTNGSPNWFRWGFYWNSVPLAPTGNIGYEVTDYEIGTAFDASWSN